MSVQEIVVFTARALRFAAIMGGFWAIARGIWLLIRKKKISWRRELALWAAVMYFSAVFEIIDVRGGLRNTRELRLCPFETTLDEFAQGLWKGVYHALGNLIWFFPAGAFYALFFPRARWHRALLLGALFSAALEAGQYVLKSGVTDVDDVILNGLGCLIGFRLWRLIEKIRFREKRKTT